ncbi:Rho/RAC guanine nucleotide exchange factor, putative [Entamoeba invadens IP1]|uniref:Rho/RAC guanine nucleotide exchange factor, putative n=1 Tax=Entamoeba invadens IP1 TaxID=370355 RepID=A0A0A1U5G5_ENTIV|nr:Rho/RAC guanine nucleotide exchange factor, putative [Entamoeba invadens IP1]ELP89562.1 Rho/RAC guanine nucleotide exchange factor, putative [Entamoeba invadens IP1]|eukprot:XP_004256333.1 Rho/RAC guanine nucleotide exchange factor, putative [Entamoeba invadens IP1]
MEKYVAWVNDHLPNSSLYITSLEDFKDGHAFLCIMEQITHTTQKTDTPLESAMRLAEKQYGKMSGLSFQKIAEGEERQIIALVGFLMKQETMNLNKMSNSLARSETLSESTRRRAFTVRKDGKMVGVTREKSDKFDKPDASIVALANQRRTASRPQKIPSSVKPIPLVQSRAFQKMELDTFKDQDQQHQIPKVESSTESQHKTCAKNLVEDKNNNLKSIKDEKKDETNQKDDKKAKESQEIQREKINDIIEVKTVPEKESDKNEVKSEIGIIETPVNKDKEQNDQTLPSLTVNRLEIVNERSGGTTAQKRRENEEEEKTDTEQVSHKSQLKVPNKNGLQEMREVMQKEEEKQLQDDKEIKELQTQKAVADEDEDEKMAEVYRGVFLYEGKLYVVDEFGSGMELKELVIDQELESVTSIAKTLLYSTNYNNEIEKQNEQFNRLDAQATDSVLKHILLIQKRIRGFCVRKLPEVCGLKERKNLVKELVESEHKYVANLRILQKNYLSKLLEEKDDKVLRGCLKNLEMIITYNSTFETNLNAMLKTNIYGTGISTVLSKFSKFLKCYTTYVNSYDQTSEYIVGMKKKNKAFTNNLKQLSMQPEVNNLDIFAYLILPIQRVPRYELFIKGFLKYLPRSHVEFEKLQPEIKTIKEIGDYLNERRRQSENKQLLIKLKHHLETKKFDLTGDEKRQLIKYGSFNTLQFGPIILFLLSDTILIGMTKTKVKDVDAYIEKNKIKIKYVINLFALTMYWADDTHFTLQNTNFNVRLTSDSATDQEDWMLAIDEVLAKNHSSIISRLLAVETTEGLNTNISSTSELFYRGKLKMQLKMFEKEKKILGLSTFAAGVELKSKEVERAKVSPLALSPRERAAANLLMTPRGFTLRPKIEVNDHHEEKDRYCVLENGYLYVYNTLAESLSKDKWHMKVVVSAISAEAVVAVNNAAAFKFNIRGESQTATAVSVQDKWKWISVLRAVSINSAREKLYKLNLLPDTNYISYSFPVPKFMIFEREKLSNYIDLLISITANTVCADCGDNKTIYLDDDNGVILCKTCGDIHKKALGSNIVVLRELYKLIDISKLDSLKNRGNEVVNGVIDAHIPQDVKVSTQYMLTSVYARESYIPKKYTYFKV